MIRTEWLKVGDTVNTIFGWLVITGFNGSIVYCDEFEDGEEIPEETILTPEEIGNRMRAIDGEQHHIAIDNISDLYDQERRKKKMTEYNVRRDENKKETLLKDSLKKYHDIEQFLIESSLTVEDFETFLKLSESYIESNNAYKMYLLLGE